jgi:hypothetical protein
MSIHAEADLILKLYELRREPTMRIARDWFFTNFNPTSMADLNAAMFSEHSGHLRMVMSYWEMAATLVNHGAIGVKLFDESNGEHIGVFSKVEPILAEVRAAYGPQFMANLEKLIDATPDGRQKVAKSQEMYKMIKAQMEKMQTHAAGKS